MTEVLHRRRPYLVPLIDLVVQGFYGCTRVPWLRPGLSASFCPPGADEGGHLHVMRLAVMVDAADALFEPVGVKRMS